MNEFSTLISCNAHTPKIQSSGYFHQTVEVQCSTNLGPAIVNLQSLYITVGGKDAWNKAGHEYLGRSLSKALGKNFITR